MFGRSGGFGGNTGVQDAHNLAWKLAYVLKGQAGKGLLDTYEEERYPVAKHTVENVLAHYVHRTEPGMKYLVDEYDVKECPVEHMELGYRYHSMAMFTQGPFEASDITEDPATSIAGPGSIAYHVLVNTTDGKKDVAISELLGDGFVLFVGPEGKPWIDAMRSTEAQKYPLKFVQLEFDEKSAFSLRYGVEKDGAVLIRPDGFVAWSCKSLIEGDGSNDLRPRQKVMERVLCLGR